MNEHSHSDVTPILESQNNVDISEDAELCDDPATLGTSKPIENSVVGDSSSSKTEVDGKKQTGSELSSSLDGKQLTSPPDGIPDENYQQPGTNKKQQLSEKPRLSSEIHQEEDENAEEAKPNYTGRTFFGTFIELPLFFILLGYSFGMMTNQNLLMFKICHVHLNHSENVCSNLADNQSIKEQVQSISTDYSMIQSFIQNIPPIFFAFFLGTWSDRHGRRYPIMFAIAGNLGSAVVSFIVASSAQMPAEYLFIASTFQGAGGGFVTLMLGIFSYVSDVSSQAKRTLSIARADLALGGALAIGMLVSGVIVQKWGFMPVFGISAAMSVISMIYIIFVIEESVPPLPEELQNRCGLLTDLFDVSNVVGSLRTCLRWRENNKRMHIILLIISQCILLLPFIGETSVLFFYTNYRFNWTQTDLSYYSAGGIVVSVLGLVVLFRFVIRRFQISDVTCGLLGVTGGILKGIVIGISWDSWVMYAAACLSCLQPISIPMLRAMLSKTVAADEQGRIFSLIVCFEAIIPLFASTMYTQTYNGTRTKFPGAVFVMSSALSVIPLTLLTFIYVDTKRRQAEQQSKIYKTQDNSTSA